MKKLQTELICTGCSTEFIPTRADQLYCSKHCRNLATRGRSGTAIKYPHLMRSAVGSIGELRVAVDLLIKGFEVFTACNAGSPWDLMAVTKEKAIRIQVRTASKNPNTGTLMYGKKKTDCADVYALVLSDEIIYRPPL